MLTDQLAFEAIGPDRLPVPFRPLHYLGSKVRMLDPIEAAIDGVDTQRGTVLDVFSGSGVVAARLAGSRPVVAVDIQEYARVLATALLSPSRPRLREIVRRAREREAALAAGAFAGLLRHERACTAALAAGDPEPLCDVLEHGSVHVAQLGEGPRAGELADVLGAAAAAIDGLDSVPVLTRTYGGVYFAYRQALALDCIIAAVRERDGVETGLAAVMGAATDCVTSVGNHFAQPLRPRDGLGRPKLASLRSAFRRRALDVFDLFEARLRAYAALPPAAHRAQAVRADYREFLQRYDGAVTAVYADPPYTRDHYSRFYHVLETIAVGDAPDVSRMRLGGDERVSRGLYRPERHQSPFCIKSQAPGAFDALFASVAALGAPLVLSYSPYSGGTAARPQPRLLTVEQLEGLASAHFRAVQVTSGGRLSHSKFNASHLNGDATDEAEVLIVCH